MHPATVIDIVIIKLFIKKGLPHLNESITCNISKKSEKDKYYFYHLTFKLYIEYRDI